MPFDEHQKNLVIEFWKEEKAKLVLERENILKDTIDELLFDRTPEDVLQSVMRYLANKEQEEKEK